MKFYQNKSWLFDQYEVKKKSITQIAREQNVSYQTIQNYLEKFNIKRHKGMKR